MHIGVRTFDTFADSTGVHFVGIDETSKRLWQASVDQIGNLQSSSWDNIGGSYEFKDVLAVEDKRAVEQIFAIGVNGTMWRLDEQTRQWTEEDGGHQWSWFLEVTDKRSQQVDHISAEDANSGSWFRKDQDVGGRWKGWVHDPSI
jgi:hypothetical protein